nr:aldehyde dehydrogenase family protein [Collimonas sp. OK307]
MRRTVQSETGLDRAARQVRAKTGGYKQSGNGRDKSLHAFDKYTEVKTIWINIT